MIVTFKKFLNGGAFAPFLSSYTPVLPNKLAPDAVLAMLANMQSPDKENALESKSKKSNSSDETMKLLGDLRGLDNDVAAVTALLQKSATMDSLFGGANSTTLYYRTLNLVNKVIEAKEDYKETFDIAKSNKTLSEAAISSDGRVVVKTGNGYLMVNAKQALLLALTGKVLICKNSDLLSDRRHNPNMAFDNSVLDVVKNGVSFDSIKGTIDSIISGLGESSIDLDGYAYRNGNQIVKGIQAIKEAGVGPMQGVYKQHFHNKTQEAQAKMAVDAIYRNLNAAQRTYLMLNTDGTLNGAYNMIREIVMGKTKSEMSFTSEYFKNMNLDGSAKSSKTDENGNPISDMDTDPAIEFANGMGRKDHFQLRTKNSGQTGLDLLVTSISMLNAEGKPMQAGTLQDLGDGRLGGIGDWSQATMNGARLNPNMLNMIVVSGRVYETELPVDLSKLAQGIVAPDLQLLDKMEEVSKLLGSLRGVSLDKLTKELKQLINQIYAKNGLQAKYDERGNLTAPYRRFMMVAGQGSEKAFLEDDLDDSQLFELDDNSQRDAYNSNIQRFNGSAYKDYKIKNSIFGSDSLYQGTVFVPMSDNWNDYYTGSGIKPSAEQAISMEARQQRTEYLRNKYNNPGNLQI